MSASFNTRNSSFNLRNVSFNVRNLTKNKLKKKKKRLRPNGEFFFASAVTQTENFFFSLNNQNQSLYKNISLTFRYQRADIQNMCIHEKQMNLNQYLYYYIINLTSLIISIEMSIIGVVLLKSCISYAFHQYIVYLKKRF